MIDNHAKSWSLSIRITLGAITALILFGLTLSVQAAEYRTSESVTVASDEVIADDLFISGNTLQIDGVVEGDVYAAGQQIILNGTIEGDLIVAGSNITIAGDIGGSLRAAGQNLNILSADIGGGVSFFGASLSSSSESTIGNGVLFFGNSATLSGEITHGITTMSSNITINGTVGTNSQIATEKLTINDGADIAGSIEYRSNRNAEVGDDATIAGDITKIGDFKNYEMGWQISKYVFSVWSFLAALLTGLVLILLARKPLRSTAEVIARRPLHSFLWGLLVLIATMPLGGLLIASVFGIPLGLLLWTSFWAALYISKFIVSIYLGKMLLTHFADQKRPRTLHSFLLGLPLLYLINLVPVLTFFVSLAVACFGLGSISIRTYEAIRAQYAPAKKTPAKQA